MSQPSNYLVSAFLLPGLISLVARSLTLMGLLWLIAAPGAWAQQLAREASGLLQDLERYEQQLEEYEFEYGFFDIRLQEPLLAIEALHAELGDYPEMRATQNRRLQLTRTALGLEHPDIIPLVEAMVRTDIRLSNWTEVSDHLEHLHTLTVANYGIDSEQAMLALQKLVSEERQEDASQKSPRAVVRPWPRWPWGHGPMGPRAHGAQGPQGHGPVGP